MRIALPALFALACLVAETLSPSAFAQIPPGAATSNVRVIGYSEVDGRPPFKLSVQERNGRWYLYAGHLWHRGWTVLDVTDPAKPSVANFIPGPANTWTIQMEIGDDKMVTALEKIGQGWGGEPSQPNDEGVLIWSLADPIHPKRLGQYKTGGTGTHRNFYSGGRYMHLAAGMPGYSGNIYVIVDIANPAKPVEAGRWWLPGQHTAGGEKLQREVSVHGPPYVEGSLVYISYGAAGLVILDIADVARPKLVGQLPFTPPFLGFIGAHSALPLPSRKIAVVNSEAIREDCKEPLNHASLVDIADPAKPTLLSIFPLPLPPAGSPYKNFCEKGGRFGPHNLNQLYHNKFVERSDKLVYLTYFNAGLRIVDISDARAPREVGYFIPPDPTKRYGTLPTKMVAQAEDVLVDARGYIYVTEKNQGLWILRYTGGTP
jgi:hypothetical protein